MKRILFFTLTYHPFIGGAEVAVKEVTDRISEEEYHFDMITLRLKSELPKFERFGHIDIFRIGFTKREATVSDAKQFPLSLNKYIYPFWAAFYAAILHRRKPYDAVMSTMTSYASFGALFFKLLFPGIPYIVRSDDGDPFEYYEGKTKLLGPMFAWLFSKADAAVATARHLANHVIRLGFRGEVAIVPNGVNAKHFSQQYTEAEIKEVQEKLGKKEGDVFMITTSRLVKKNAVDDVIKAMKFLPEHVYFLVYGIGPDEEMLIALAKSEGVEKRVRFMGQLSHADMPKYLKACDIFIRPSLSEGFGISFIEAMVAEIPVIATQAGGIADYLFDSELNRDQMPTGYVVATRDPEGIARQVKRCLEDSALRVSVIKNAKTLAIERYDWDRIAKQMKEGVFDKLLK
jgi:glycosyltransferase involved in cell wall biosynthesis